MAQPWMSPENVPIYSRERAFPLPVAIAAGSVFWCFVFFVEMGLWDQQRLVRQYPLPLFGSLAIYALIGAVLAAALWVLVLRRVVDVPARGRWVFLVVCFSSFHVVFLMAVAASEIIGVFGRGIWIESGVLAVSLLLWLVAFTAVARAVVLRWSKKSWQRIGWITAGLVATLLSVSGTRAFVYDYAGSGDWLDGYLLPVIL